MTCFRSLQVLYVSGLVFCGLAVLGQGVAFPEDSLQTPAQTDGTRTITIVMESYTFTPNTLTAEIGKPITLQLKNESFLVPHNFLLDSPSGIRLIEENVDSGEEATIQFTPTESGVYLFYCDKQLLFFPNHREEGMEGSITVP